VFEPIADLDKMF
jgi:hypothetical protein